MWKKRKDIDGVSTGSIIDLKSVLYQEEQNARASSKGSTTERRSTKLQTILQNKGVGDRNSRDIEDRGEDGEVSSEVLEAKLRAKSELYDRMKSGGYKDNEEDEEDPYSDRGYLVDFEQKSWNEEKKRKSEFEYRYDPRDDDDDYDNNNSSRSNNNSYNSKNTYSSTTSSRGGKEMEETRKLWEREGLEETNRERDSSISRARKMDIIDDVVYETKKGREKHQEAKTKRKQALEDRMRLVKERQKQQQQQQQTQQKSVE